MPSSACTTAPTALHSFPTRRSSDLETGVHAYHFAPGQRIFQCSEFPDHLGGQIEDANRHVDRHRIAVWVDAETPVLGAKLRHELEHRSEEHTSELQSLAYLVCRLLLAPPPPQLYTLSLHDALPIWRQGFTRITSPLANASSNALSSRITSAVRSRTPTDTSTDTVSRCGSTRRRRCSGRSSVMSSN